MTNRRGIIPCQIVDAFKGLYRPYSPLNLFWWGGEGILYHSDLSWVDDLLTWSMRSTTVNTNTCTHTCTQHKHTFSHEVLLSFCTIWASLSKPHILCDNSPTCGIMIFMSVSFTLHLSHPGSWDLCTPWNPPCISVYWHAHVHDLQLHSTEQQGWWATWVCRENYRQKQVGECADT